MHEFDLLQHVFEHNAALGERILIPPGDDLGMARLAGRDVLVGVDQLVGGRHVNLETTRLELVGRKAITRSLSDIAAMAGRPVCSLVAVTLPPDFGEARANDLFDAMHVVARQYRCPLIGGDIAFHSDPSHPLVCAVTVLAEPTGRGPILRSGARAGDSVYVTGQLGRTMDEDGGGHHLTFEPRITLAISLAEQLRDRLHSMIDLSDGLGRDAGHIARSSMVRIVLNANQIPCRDGASWREAVSDGEDYELCFTATGEVPTSIDGVPITAVGEALAITDPDRPSVAVAEQGREIDVTELGWQHQS